MDTAARIEELKAERARFLAFSFARSDLLIEIDRKGTITFASGAAQSMVGLEPPDLVGKPFSVMVAPASKAILDRIIAAASSGGWVREQSLTLAKGPGTSMATIAACPLPSRPDRYFITLALGAAPAAQPAAPAAAVAPVAPPPNVTIKRDKETGLVDAESFTALARQRLTESANTEQLKMTMVELDGLEDMEKRAGAQGGSAAFLQNVGKLLSDVAGSNNLASRVSSSKFSVLHDDKVDGSKLQNQIADMAREADPTGVGVKVRTTDVKIDKALLTDTEMSQALVYAVNKFAQSATGGFTLDSLSAGVKTFMDDAVASIGKFRETIASDGYDLVFQPIVDLQTRQIHHQEALSRLPDGSSPFALVTFAEQIGFIADFDLMVLRKALKYLAEFPAAYDVGINVSGRSLASPAFVDEFVGTLKKSAPLSHRLIVEITESSTISDLGAVDKIVQVIRGNKNKVYIDDFGSGAAAFHYLRELHVDVVKIDGAYIRDIEKNARDRAFVRSIISLSIELGLGTVGEFVETPGQVKILGSLGLQYGQGYLFGKPSKDIHQRNTGKAPITERSPLEKVIRPATWT